MVSKEPMCAIGWIICQSSNQFSFLGSAMICLKNANVPPHPSQENFFASSCSNHARNSDLRGIKEKKQRCMLKGSWVSPLNGLLLKPLNVLKIGLKQNKLSPWFFFDSFDDFNCFVLFVNCMRLSLVVYSLIWFVCYHVIPIASIFP